MQAEKLMGIKETSEVIALVGAMMKAHDMAIANGKYEFADLAFLMTVVPFVAPAIDKIGDVWDEMKDLDEGEIMQLLDKANEELKLPDASKYVVSVKEGFKIFVSVKAILAAWKS